MRICYVCFISIIALINLTGPDLCAQSLSGARILILPPNITAIDADVRKEIQRIEQERKDGYTYRSVGSPGDTQMIVRVIDANREVLSHTASFSTDIAIMTQDILLYTLFETSPEILVLVDEHGRPGDVNSLRTIVQTDSMDYVIALRSVSISHQREGWRATVDFSIYETRTDSLLLTYATTVDDQGSGDMFSCRTGTFHCIPTNVCKAIWEQFIQSIYRRDPRILQGR
jgi:hypothetical protein